VSRGLVKALAAAPPAGMSVPDAQLVTEMWARMAREPRADLHAIVVEAKAALETMARTIDGCHGVDSQLTVRSEIPYHYGV
jgi:hypothetical protein